MVVNIGKNLTSDDKVSAGVDVELGLGVQVLLGDGGVDDLLHDVLPQGLQSDLLAVLAGHDHGVHPDGDAGPALEHVLGSDLQQKPVLCTGSSIMIVRKFLLNALNKIWLQMAS